jgi:hypothetical protein
VADQDLRELNKTLWGVAQAVVQSSEESMWKTCLHFLAERCINDGAMNMTRFSGSNDNSSGSCEN